MTRQASATEDFRMKSFRRLLAAGFCLVLATPVQAAPANTLQELFAGLSACMGGVEGEPGEQVTIAFSLKRDGALFGKPKITYSKLPSDPATQRRFLDGVAAKFGACLPTPISDSLGGAIAGRRLTLRFVVKGREQPI